MVDVRHVYTAVYQGAGSTPERVSAAVSITAGKRITVAVPAISWRGYLTRLYVAQASGTGADFTVEVLNSKEPFPVGEALYNAAAAIGVGPFRVIAQQSKTSGQAVDLMYDVGYPWNNLDGADPTSQERYLYLVITPNNSVDTSTWDVALTTVSL